MSAAAKPVVCSAARLKRSIRASRSVTITRLPAVSRTASLKSRASRSASCARTCSVMSEADTEVADRVAGRVAFDGQPLRDAQPGAVLAHVGQLPALGLIARGAGEKHRPLRLDTERRGELIEVEHPLGRADADDFVGAVAEHQLGARVEDRDRPVEVHRDDRVAGGRREDAGEPVAAGAHLAQELLDRQPGERRHEEREQRVARRARGVAGCRRPASQGTSSTSAVAARAISSWRRVP